MYQIYKLGDGKFIMKYNWMLMDLYQYRDLYDMRSAKC
jgi:hypothetical protein